MTSERHNPASDDLYLDAARDAILAVGWSRTTLTDIARRAGVSRMTLYRRWPDTQTLLADLMTREWARVMELAAASSVEDLETGPGGTPRPASTAVGETTALDLLTHGIVATTRALRDNALVRRIVDVDPEVLLPYLLQRRGRSQEHVADVTATLVRAGQADGSVREGDPVTMARSLVLAAHGFVLSARTMADDDVTLESLDAELARLVEGYLR